MKIDQLDKKHMLFDLMLIHIHTDIGRIQLHQRRPQLNQEDMVDIVRIQMRNYQENNIHIHSMWHWLEFQVHIQHIHMMQLQH